MRARIVLAFFQEEDYRQISQRFRLVFLPTYSAWLNRIEETWRIVNAHAGTNAWRDNLDHLSAMAAHILNPTPCFLSECCR